VPPGSSSVSTAITTKAPVTGIIVNQKPVSRTARAFGTKEIVLIANTFSDTRIRPITGGERPVTVWRPRRR
jgi:hypothetical protein